MLGLWGLRIVCPRLIFKIFLVWHFCFSLKNYIRDLSFFTCRVGDGGHIQKMEKKLKPGPLAQLVAC